MNFQRAKLTDGNLPCAEGRPEELIGRTEKRTGETRAAVENAVQPSGSLYGCNQAARHVGRLGSELGSSARAGSHAGKIQPPIEPDGWCRF